MANQQTGNGINVFNLKDLLESIRTLDKYMPTRVALQIPELEQLHDKGIWHLDEVRESKNAWSLVVDYRQERYKSLGAFSSRIIGIMSGTNASPQSIETAKSIVRKLKGIKLYKPRERDIPKLDDAEPNKERSISRLSFDSMYESFSELVGLLSITEGYDSLNPEFTLEALSLLCQQLLEANYNIDKAIAKINASRIDRNEFLYSPETGLVDIALSAKNYISGLYGAKSSLFMKIDKIKFKNFR